jgi:hypothetical protein
VPDYRAATSFNPGNVHVDLQDLTPAEASYQRVIALWEQPVRDDPTVPARRRHPALAYTIPARLYEGVGRVVEAGEPGRKARDPDWPGEH